MTEAASALIDNYDPNMCSRFAYHTVEIVLARWAYRATHIVRVGGNCSGLSVLDCAVGTLYDSLPTEWFAGEELPTLRLTRPDGDTLMCQDDEGAEEDWLKEMVVSLRIIGLQPEEL